MDDNTARQVFDGAMERMARLQWVARLAIFVVAIIYLLTVTPYLARRGAAARLEAQRSEVQAALGALEAGSKIVKDYTGDVHRRLEAIKSSVFADMVGRFEQLHDAVDRERNPGRSDRLRGLDPRIQAGPPQAREVLQLDEAVREAVKAADTREELLAAVSAHVETEIIQPAFALGNEQWRQSALPALRSRTEEVQRELKDVTARHPDADELIARLRQGLADSSKALDAVRFGAPAADYWWTSHAGKEEMLASLNEGVARALQAKQIDDLVQSSEWREIAGKLESGRSRFDAGIEAEKTALAALQTNFEKQLEKIGELGAAFQYIPTDLEFIVARMPIIIAILFAGLIGASALHLPEAAWAAARLKAAGDESPALWLGVIEPQLTSHRASPWYALRGIAWLGIAWAAFAACHARWLGAASLRDIGFNIGVSLLAIAIACAVRRQSVQRARVAIRKVGERRERSEAGAAASG